MKIFLSKHFGKLAFLPIYIVWLFLNSNFFLYEYNDILFEVNILILLLVVIIFTLIVSFFYQKFKKIVLIITILFVILFQFFLMSGLINYYITTQEYRLDSNSEPFAGISFAILTAIILFLVGVFFDFLKNGLSTKNKHS